MIWTGVSPPCPARFTPWPPYAWRVAGARPGVSANRSPQVKGLAQLGPSSATTRGTLRTAPMVERFPDCRMLRSCRPARAVGCAP